MFLSLCCNLWLSLAAVNGFLTFTKKNVYCTVVDGFPNTPFRIIESLGLEKTFKIIKSNLTPPSPPLNHVPKHHTYTFLKYLQGWRLSHFPGQPVPVLDNPFSEGIFPNIQSKLAVVQLEAISSHPITGYLGEETNTHLAAAAFQVVVES